MKNVLLEGERSVTPPTDKDKAEKNGTCHVDLFENWSNPKHICTCWCVCV